MDEAFNNKGLLFMHFKYFYQFCRDFKLHEFEGKSVKIDVASSMPKKDQKKYDFEKDSDRLIRIFRRNCSNKKGIDFKQFIQILYQVGFCKKQKDNIEMADMDSNLIENLVKKGKSLEDCLSNWDDKRKLKSMTEFYIFLGLLDESVNF